MMTSIELLLENKFEPTRSVVLTFGFDEEASGPYVRILYSSATLQVFNQTIHFLGRSVSS
jgi:Gly-Xaa carboxypeptidase